MAFFFVGAIFVRSGKQQTNDRRKFMTRKQNRRNIWIGIWLLNAAIAVAVFIAFGWLENSSAAVRNAIALVLLICMVGGLIFGGLLGLFPLIKKSRLSDELLSDRQKSGLDFIKDLEDE